MEFRDKENTFDMETILSVSEFIEYVNLLLGRRQVIVEGEISSFNVSQGKWVFFDLKDKQSTVTCFTMLFRLATPLSDGMKVRVTGTPRVHQKSGRFSIFVDSVELSGEGALRKAFELTKAKLEKEGIFDAGRKRAVSRMPESIGLICSKESAAYSDFMRIVQGRWGGVDILLAHVAVQGESAIKEIVGAFEYFNTEDTGAETLVLIRGGGSLEDLQAFNSEAVARAVFGSKIPVVVGVGHERDESLADYAADVRAATPTHAATLVVPDRAECLSLVALGVRSMERHVDHLIEWRESRVQRSLASLYHFISAFTQTPDLVIQRFFGRADIFLEQCRGKENQIIRSEGSIQQYMSGVLDGQTQILMSLMRNLENLNPLTVVRRGYSIIKKQGRVVKKTTDLRVGNDISIHLSDGTIGAQITKQ